MNKRLKFKTTNLYEAGYIYASASQNFEGVEPDGRDFSFVFNNQSNQCDKLSANYFSRGADVDALTYADAIKTLKDIIFSRLRERERSYP